MAKYGKYIELTYGDNHLEERWLAHCRATQVPCVTVKVRVTFADVRWLHERDNPSVDLILARYSQELRDSAEGIFRKYSGIYSNCNVYGDLISYNNLTIENAKCAAIELYNLLIEITSRK